MNAAPCILIVDDEPNVRLMLRTALESAGYRVAANYGGNDEAAAKFNAATAIAVYKWDVSSYDACVDGVRRVTADLGPVEVLEVLAVAGHFKRNGRPQSAAGRPFAAISITYLYKYLFRDHN